MTILSSQRPVVLTIAGFDPSSGAGVTADLKVFDAHRLYGVAAITALTVQSTRGVRRFHTVNPKFLAETLDCLAEDVEISGVKIGMLGTAEIVSEVARFLAGSGIPRQRIVLDPIVRSSIRPHPARFRRIRPASERTAATGWLGHPEPRRACRTGSVRGFRPGVDRQMRHETWRLSIPASASSLQEGILTLRTISSDRRRRRTVVSRGEDRDDSDARNRAALSPRPCWLSWSLECRLAQPFPGQSNMFARRWRRLTPSARDAAR